MPFIKVMSLIKVIIDQSYHWSSYAVAQHSAYFEFSNNAAFVIFGISRFLSSVKFESMQPLLEIIELRLRFKFVWKNLKIFTQFLRTNILWEVGQFPRRYKIWKINYFNESQRDTPNFVYHCSTLNIGPPNQCYNDRVRNGMVWNGMPYRDFHWLALECLLFLYRHLFFPNSSPV